MIEGVGSTIFNFVFKGKVTLFFIIFSILSLFEIIAILSSNSHGELSSEGLFSFLLGAVIGFPWFEILIISESELLPFKLMLLTPVLLNLWIIYKFPYWVVPKAKKDA